METKHLTMGILYGLVSFMAFIGSDLSAVSFDALMILISWIALIALVYSIQWFDHVTDGYFIITMLLFFTARLARYNTISIANYISYIAIGVGLGLLAKSIDNNKGWAAIWLISIFAIEIFTIIDINIDTVDLTTYFPPIDFIDSKFTLDPTTITDWNTTPSIFN